ncbi:sensor domain-containing diguanylate cyclase [Pseudoduganella sp. LjRoot289]|uniref:diguanylate cyclase n=1 Tax=Pseudoduganella sp. LjRoot289 TaxID=3342314 RepID=UPI003ECDFF44
MRLRQLFFLLSALLSVTVMALAASVVAGAWGDLRAAGAGREAMQQLQAVLLVAEMTSRERGPANGVLGADLPGDPAGQERLRVARKKTDDAFTTLDRSLGNAVAPRARVRDELRRIRLHLEEARKTIDEVALRPRSQRSPAAIRGAVRDMIAIIEELAPVTVRLANEAAAAFPNAVDALTAARQAAALREFAGQLGSQFTAPLATRQRLSADEHTAIDRLRGRIDQLRQQLTVAAVAGQARPAVQEANRVMLEHYFGNALAFVDEQVAIGVNDGNYRVNTAQFAARYVPDMDAIVHLRDVLLDQALADASRGTAQARHGTTWTTGGAVAALALLGLTWWLLHRRVVEPLGKTTDLIVTIAHGNFNVHIPAPRHRDELADMLGAIAVLRDNSVARQTAEAAIRHMAYYDRLTGLPNRRLLEERLPQALACAQRRNAGASVLFIDLDKFKQVNDQHGHEAGDWLLQQAAGRMRAVLRESDTAARVGGDEFVVLLPDASDVRSAVMVAEKLRGQLELPFVMDSGVSLHVSSSVGVAMYPVHAGNAADLLRFGDEAMYQAKKRGRNAVAVFAAPTPAMAGGEHD